jgi:Glycosyltransferase like family
MIAFGCSISEPEPYVRYAQPGIQLAAEPGSAIFPFAAVGTVGRSYNLLIDAAAAHADLEALVIVHPHTEIADRDLPLKLREAFSDPDVAVVGCAGATGVRTVAWWDGEVSCGEVTHRYLGHRGGELPAFSWAVRTAAPAEVDTVDGFFIALSPWAVRNLRFDEGLLFGHGFDLDFCLQVRAAGRKVMTADVRVIEHRSLELVSDLELWVEAHIQLARKWEGRMPSGPGPTVDWKLRARRAEAQREAARAIAYSRKLGLDARIVELERQLSEATETFSWRITAPLRRMNQLLRDARSRRAASAAMRSR